MRGSTTKSHEGLLLTFYNTFLSSVNLDSLLHQFFWCSISIHVNYFRSEQPDASQLITYSDASWTVPVISGKITVGDIMVKNNIISHLVIDFKTDG
jgi:hypothetical protein